MAVDFKLGTGGPFHRVEQAAHLDDLRRQVLAAIGVSWVPLVALSLVQWSMARRVEPMMSDLSIHARLLLALPLFLIAERKLDRSCGAAVRRLFGEGFVGPEQEEAARAALRSAERWRDSPVPETLFLVLALLVGLAGLAGVVPSAGLGHGIAASGYGAVRVWYALVSLPLFQFLLWRSLYRWGLWARVLADLARLPLRLLPMHTDRRGGIAFLKQPSIAYCALLLLAASSVLCGGWATRILLYDAEIEVFKPLFYAFVLVGTFIAFAPLLAFLPLLSRARSQGRRAYGGLLCAASRRFQERWLGVPAPADLDHSEIQTLAALGASYRENVERMQILLFDLRDCILLFVVALLPGIPILLTEVPARELLRHLLRLLTGGI